MLPNIGKNPNRDKDMTHPNVFSELKERFLKPWNISFTLYFILIIVCLGGMGVIVALRNGIFNKDWSGFPLTLMTYSLALLVPSVISIILHYYQANNKVSLVLLCLTCVVATSLSTFFASIISASCFVILAWILWVIANADNVELNDNAYNDNIQKDLGDHGKGWN